MWYTISSIEKCKIASKVALIKKSCIRPQKVACIQVANHMHKKKPHISVVFLFALRAKITFMRPTIFLEHNKCRVWRPRHTVYIISYHKSANNGSAILTIKNHIERCGFFFYFIDVVLLRSLLHWWYRRCSYQAYWLYCCYLRLRGQYQ